MAHEYEKMRRFNRSTRVNELTSTDKTVFLSEYEPRAVHTTKAVGEKELICGHLRSTWRALSHFKGTDNVKGQATPLQEIVMARSLKRGKIQKERESTNAETSHISFGDEGENTMENAQSYRQRHSNGLGKSSFANRCFSPRGYERGLDGTAEVLPKMVPITSSDIYYENEMRAELQNHTLRSGTFHSIRHQHKTTRHDKHMLSRKTMSDSCAVE